MIKELTLRVTDLEKKAIAFCREKDVPFPIANYLVDFATEATKQLEKENAELKAQLESERDLPAIAYQQGAEKQKKKDEEELKKWKDEWQEQVQKATDEGYARTLQTIQLTKAKEILQRVVKWATTETCKCEKFDFILADTKQFLNSEVEK